jgi:Nuclease A inhibitor-like protein
VASDLQGAKVFKVGDDPEKQAYVVGKTGDGNWAGLKTIVVET